MVHLEGVLVSWNHHINAAAMGVNIEDNKMSLRVYLPSDTGNNLELNKKFTYSLTDDPELFFKAALTGANTGFSELEDNDIESEGCYFFPKKATQTFFCEADEIVKRTIKDRYGTSDVLDITALITGKKGEGEYIQRENPLIDAMVHATRYPIVEDEPTRDEIRRAVKTILVNEDGELARRIRKKVGVET